MYQPPRILVIGAINQDETARVAHHPALGETVVTASIEMGPGGKGANQAAAAASSGYEVRVSMLGAVGDDAAGDAQLTALADVGVSTTLVRRVLGTPTGRAYITVSDSGENTIVVGLGANAFVSTVNLNGAPRPAVAVAQSEIGAAALSAVGRLSEVLGARLVLNNGPAIDLPADLLRAADPLIVNEGEARQMLCAAGAASDGPAENLPALLRGQVESRSVVVTLGAAGSAIADNLGTRGVPAVRVSRVVDTTGAGDVFIGVLAAALASDRTLDEAVTAGTSAAAEAVQWLGARKPMVTDPKPLTSVI